MPIAYLTGHLTLAQLFVVGFTAGVLTVFFDVAYQSYLPALVDRELLIDGNSKLEVTRSAGQLAGPPVAGGLIQLLTAPYAVVWDSVSFFISGAFLLAIRKKEPPREQKEDGRRAGMRHELWEGLWSTSSSTRYLRPQAISTGTSNFFTNVAFSIVSCSRSGRCGMSAGADRRRLRDRQHRLARGRCRRVAPAAQARGGRRDDPRLRALSGPATLLVALDARRARRCRSSPRER